VVLLPLSLAFLLRAGRLHPLAVPCALKGYALSPVCFSYPIYCGIPASTPNATYSAGRFATYGRNYINAPAAGTIV